MKFDDPEWVRQWKEGQRQSRKDVRQAARATSAEQAAQLYRTRIPAAPGSDLAQLRQECHRTFDVLWQLGVLKRNEVYRRLADAMGIARDECHFGMFNIERCQRALALRNAPEFVAGIPAVVED